LNGAGPELDRLIERKLNGDAKKRTPPYSTSEKAANRLLRRLEMQDMPCTVEQIDGVWYCTFWIVYPASRERLSTGRGETRALAIARAVVNARLGMDASLSGSSGAIAGRVRWSSRLSAPAGEERACAGCGTSLPIRNREAANRYCTVCSWRASRVQSEAGRSLSRLSAGNGSASSGDGEGEAEAGSESRPAHRPRAIRVNAGNRSD
jgi:hypothetical protein